MMIQSLSFLDLVIEIVDVKLLSTVIIKIKEFVISLQSFPSFLLILLFFHVQLVIGEHVFTIVLLHACLLMHKDMQEIVSLQHLFSFSLYIFYISFPLLKLIE